MPNNARTQVDGTWIDGYVPPDSDWEDLDRKTFHSWNGDKGGSYSGSESWDIGGAGLQVTGPTRLTYGGAIYGGSGAFVIADGTWPELGANHAGRTRSIVQTISVFSSPRPYMWSRNHDYGGVGSVALALRGTFKSDLETPEMYVPLRVVDGARLASVTIHFRVAVAREKAPVAMPKFRVLRVPADSRTTAPEPLKATDDGLGFDSPALVTTPSAWYLDGAAQSFTYTCDQNETIDVANYSYVVHIVDEVASLDTLAPFDGMAIAERKNSCDIVAFNTETADILGLTFADGKDTAAYRMLVVDAPGSEAAGRSARNGIWIWGLTPARAEDLDSAEDFSPFAVVYVTQGVRGAGSLWQIEYPTASMRVSLLTTLADSSDGCTWPRIVPAKPRGNIYHSVVPTFEVSDLRFQ